MLSDRFFITPNKYFTTTSKLYAILYDCIKVGSQYLTERQVRNINVFWRDDLSTYKSFIDMVKPKNINEIMSIPLWCNKNIKVGGNTVFYKTWNDNGIMCLRDIFNVNGQILSYEEFRLKYNFQTNFLEFYGLINSVRQYINSFNYQEILGIFVCCLAHRGSTVGFLLLQCSSGLVRHPRDIQVSVATRFCRVLIFASSQYLSVIYLFHVMIH